MSRSTDEVITGPNDAAMSVTHVIKLGIEPKILVLAALAH